MYSGAQPNQQILPAYDWGKEKGFKKYFLVGSDYVFPRTANLILKKHIENDKLTLSGEEYQPMGGTDFSGVIAKIRSEEHTSELQSLMRNSYAVFCLKTKNKKYHNMTTIH